MKISTFLSLILVTTVFSCKKNDSNSSSPHMSVTIDGKTKNFSGIPLIATKSGGTLKNNISMIAMTSPDMTGEMMTLIISSDNDIVAGTYTDETADMSLSAVYTASMTTGKQYMAGTNVRENADFDNITIKNHYKLTIVSIDAKGIRGNFSGDIFPDDDPQHTPIPMTNGEFYAKFQ